MFQRRRGCGLGPARVRTNLRARGMTPIRRHLNSPTRGKSDSFDSFVLRPSLGALT